MLVNEITQQLERSSLSDDIATLPLRQQQQQHIPSVTLPQKNVEGQVERVHWENENPVGDSTSPSPLVRGTTSRLSLPFSSGVAAPKGKLLYVEARESTVSNEDAADLDLEEELPTKRRHCSWAAADFRLLSGMSLARRSEMARSDSVEANAVGLIRPIPVRPVVASNEGSKNDWQDDSACGYYKHSGLPSAPRASRPSSASSGIFDLDTSSECSALRGEKLDRSASNGWSSSADERRRSDEDSTRQFVAAAAAAAATAVHAPRCYRSFARHSRGSHTNSQRLSTSGGFLPLNNCSDLSSSNCIATQTSETELPVPPSPAKSNMGSSWWRSAPDLVGANGGTFGTAGAHHGSEDDSSDWRRSQRKRTMTGRLQARPSIDLFKNVNDDDSSAESLISSEAVTDGACSDGNDSHHRSCFGDGNDGGRLAESSNRIRQHLRQDLEAEDDCDTDSDTSLKASSRSTAGTFSMGTSSTEPTPVTRSLSYPWLRSQLSEEPHGNFRKPIGISTRRSANVVPALIDDMSGLKTIVGSPADTITPVATVSLPVRSNESFSSSPRAINLLNFVAETIITDHATAPADTTVKSLGTPDCKVVPPENEDSPANHALSLDDAPLDAPPQLIEGPIMFLSRYNFQNEIDIDLIEQN